MVVANVLHHVCLSLDLDAGVVARNGSALGRVGVGYATPHREGDGLWKACRLVDGVVFGSGALICPDDNEDEGYWLMGRLNIKISRADERQAGVWLTMS